MLSEEKLTSLDNEASQVDETSLVLLTIRNQVLVDYQSYFDKLLFQSLLVKTCFHAFLSSYLLQIKKTSERMILGCVTWPMAGFLLQSENGRFISREKYNEKVCFIFRLAPLAFLTSTAAKPFIEQTAISLSRQAILTHFRILQASPLNNSFRGPWLPFAKSLTEYISLVTCI